MARARSPNREKAETMYLESGGNMLLKDIAEQLGVSDSQIRKWKNQDQWEAKLNSNVTNTNSNVTKRVGAPEGNKNAVGNRGGAAPKRNSNAVSHGFFRKYFPEETADIMEEIESKSPIDMLWENIVIQYTAIVRAQRIMFVRDQDDETRVLKKEKPGMFGTEEEWEYQHAWDKQATFLNAQSRAMATLQGLIKRYEEMLNSSLATEEQHFRVQKLKGEIAVLEQKTSKDDDKPIEILIKRKGEG
ncbi:phage terminase small subunit [Brevibacillus laterosporus]|uniref:Phage terminase small subunit n=1 Tax=Brevibacillus halotolerans TaxID=1507437 RepID=A0ABT4HYE5_9BACL|nr:MULTISPECIES: phage terminase small subunit [Brevibacillus]MCR8986078.1 phage terminase small subunit [Brevibacillus laterosporus]MCZ0831811.1 phage terminase small subunit [Brevibacillus halotolerans]